MNMSPVNNKIKKIDTLCKPNQSDECGSWNDKFS